MKPETEKIITVVIQGDDTIKDKKLIEKVIGILSGAADSDGKGLSSFDRVLSRKDVQELWGFKSPKSVDQYARKHIFERVILPGNSRGSGYSESSVRKALASRG